MKTITTQDGVTVQISDEKLQEIIESSKKEEKETKKLTVNILNKWNGSIVFESTKETLREAVIEAVNSGANLSEADLSGADLSGADLYGVEMMDVKFYGKTYNPKLLKSNQVDDFLAALGFKVEN